MTKKSNQKQGKKKTIDELLKIITKECENGDWSWRIDAIDEKEYSSATISVQKSVSFEPISALVHLLILQNNKIQYNIEKTSFHDYGTKALFRTISNALDRGGYKEDSKITKQENNKAIDTLIQIFKKFHIAALQMSKRHDNRETLTIKDEFDVQDFVHSLLKIHFDDIRPEEYTPSYAGSASRIDFLLKDEKTLIEVKYATSNLKDSKIGEQLIVDIEKYKSHPDCETLICFVYDPNFNIKNPHGLEKDLSGKKDKLVVQVCIYPK
jgi:hypothetical protein